MEAGELIGTKATLKLPNLIKTKDMNTTRAIVVEDEKKNMDLLLHFIEKYCPSVEVVATCMTFKDALNALNTIKVGSSFSRTFF